MVGWLPNKIEALKYNPTPTLTSWDRGKEEISFKQVNVIIF